MSQINDIPSITELRTQVIDERVNRKATQQQHVADALKRRSDTRLTWTQEKQDEYSQQLEKMQVADTLLTTHMINLIIEEVKKMLKQGKTVWQFEYHLPTTDGIHALSAMFGFWKKTKNRYDYLSRYEAGLITPFWHSLGRIMRPKGYLIEDISDRQKSHRMFMRIKIATPNLPTTSKSATPIAQHKPIVSQTRDAISESRVDDVVKVISKPKKPVASDDSSKPKKPVNSDDSADEKKPSPKLKKPVTSDDSSDKKSKPKRKSKKSDSDSSTDSD